MMDWDSILITVLHDDGVVVQDEYSYSLQAEQRMIIFGGEPGPQGPAGPEGPQGPPGYGAEWGNIVGTLADQTDLQDALDAKANTADLGDLATQDTVDYDTEVTNKPTLGTMAAVDDAPSDDKEYARKNGAWSEVTGGGGGTWGSITGTLSDQTDLQNALNAKADTAIIAHDFDPTASYNRNDYVIYQGTLYRFTAAHSAGAWIGSDVTAVTVGDELDAANDAIAQKAPLASPAFTGTPTAPTPAASDDSTAIATTAFVHSRGVFHVSGSIAQGSTKTFSASGITSTMHVINVAWGTPSNVTSDVTWTTATGTVTFAGTFAGATTIDFDLIEANTLSVS